MMSDASSIGDVVDRLEDDVQADRRRRNARGTAGTPGVTGRSAAEARARRCRTTAAGDSAAARIAKRRHRREHQPIAAGGRTTSSRTIAVTRPAASPALRRCRRTPATSTGRSERSHSRASLGTTSSAHSGSVSRWLIVGGITPRAIVSARTAASMAPAAPRQWPIIDLIALTGTEAARSPNTR